MNSPIHKYARFDKSVTLLIHSRTQMIGKKVEGKTVQKETKVGTILFEPLNVHKVDPQCMGASRLLSPLSSYFHSDVPASDVSSKGEAVSEKIGSRFSNTYESIKFVEVFSSSSVFIGNENQIDLLEFGNQGNIANYRLIWSLSAPAALLGLAPPRNLETKFLAWTEREVLVYLYNPKKIEQKAQVIKSIDVQFPIISVQMVKKNTFIVCGRSEIAVYELSEISQKFMVEKEHEKSFECPGNFEVLQVPKLEDNEIKIFYANPKQNPEKKIFGLYFVSVEYSFGGVKISEMRKVYEIKNSLRGELRLINITSSIFLMNLRTEVLAVKNGTLIDNVNVNFKFENCFIRMVSKDTLLHILVDRIEFYHVTINFGVAPEKIVVRPFDSVSFSRPFEDALVQAVPINEGYGVFFQAALDKVPEAQSKNGVLKYWYRLTYPVNLRVKLDQIFPTAEEIDHTDFEVLDIRCDMAVKMGLDEKEAYRELWRRTTKSKEKDFEILLLSKDYAIVTEQTVQLLKIKSQKFRDIVKNETICLDFLRVRVFSDSCSAQNLQEYCQCHFFCQKLNVFKEISVEKRRLDIQEYQTLIRPSEDNINLILSYNIDRKIAKKNSRKSVGSSGASEEEEREHIQTEQTEKQRALSRLAELVVRGKTAVQQRKEQSRLLGKGCESLSEMSERIKGENSSEIRMSIKDFHLYKDCMIKQQFLDIASELMNDCPNSQKKVLVFTLRALIRNFRLLFRLEFSGIFQELLVTYKHRLLQLLELLPQLLPYQHKDLGEDEDQRLYYGVWRVIEDREIENSIFVSDLVTIENRETVGRFSEDLWFKRYRLSKHGVITENKEKIKARFSEERIQSFRNHFFFLFYSKMIGEKFKLLKELQVLESHEREQKWPEAKQKLGESKQKCCRLISSYNRVLELVEKNYQWTPPHLVGYVAFYQELYLFLSGVASTACSSLYEFLQLKDYELFEVYFRVEKSRKNFIVNSIIPLYERCTREGTSKFILAVRNYFESDLSQVTDLKTILNRLNGQKQDFNVKFEALYHTLVTAMMQMVRVGTEDDVPLQELLIYVKNVPFSCSNRDVLEKLLFIQEVEYEMETVRAARLDMSLLEVQQNPERVMARFAKTEIAKDRVLHVRNQQEFYWHLLKSHAELECIKHHFYMGAIPNFVLFCIFTEVLQRDGMISMVKETLSNPENLDFFGIDFHLIKSTVMYCYRLRLTRNPSRYLDSEAYLRCLLELLPAGDRDRQFVELEIEYCYVFEKCEHSVSYPISMQREIPTLEEMEYYVEKIESEKLHRLDINRLFEIFEAMRSLLEPDLQEDAADIELKKREFIKELYEFKLFKFLRNQEFRNAVEIVERLVALQLPHNPVIYCIVLIDALLGELSDKTKNLIVEAISYYYEEAPELTAILKSFIVEPHTAQEINSALHGKIKRKRKLDSACTYSLSNSVFKKELRAIVESEVSGVLGGNLWKVVENTLRHLEKASEYLEKHKAFQIIFRILLLDPFMAAKFVYLKQGEFNLKALRMFLSLMSQEIIFDPRAVLRIGKLLFKIILNKMTRKMSLSHMIAEYSELEADEMNLCEESVLCYGEAELSESESLIFKSYESMARKIEFLENENLEIKFQKEQEKAKVALSRLKQGKHFVNKFPTFFKDEKARLIYFLNSFCEIPYYQPFSYLYKCDSDDGYIEKCVEEFIYPRLESWKCPPEFDEEQSRHQIFILGKNTRMSSPSINRKRKKSQYLPEKFEPKKPPKMSTANINILQIPDSEERVSNRVFNSNCLSPKVGRKEKHAQLFVKTKGLNGNLIDKQEQNDASEIDSVASLKHFPSIEEDCFDNFLTESSRGYTDEIRSLAGSERIPLEAMVDHLYKNLHSGDSGFDRKILLAEKVKLQDEFDAYVKELSRKIYEDRDQSVRARVHLVASILQEFCVPDLKYQILKIICHASEVEFDESLTSIAFEEVFRFEDMFMKLASDHAAEEYFKVFFKRIRQFINEFTLEKILQVVLRAFGKESFHEAVVFEAMEDLVAEILQDDPQREAIRHKYPDLIDKLDLMIDCFLDLGFLREKIRQMKQSNSSKYYIYKLCLDQNQKQ